MKAARRMVRKAVKDGGGTTAVLLRLLVCRSGGESRIISGVVE